MSVSPEMIEAAMEKTPFLPNHINRAWMAEALSAALSVQPAAAVVGEPVGYVSATELVQLKMGASCVDLFREPQPGGIDFAPIYAAPSAPEGWQSIESAPHACHVIACYFYECEWIYDVVLSPPSPPFTHWKILPAPPALGGSHDD